MLRSYRKRFVIVCEGKVTEPDYFRGLQNDNVSIELVNRSRTDSAPDKVLRSMTKHLKKKPLKKDDEAWLVIDRDNWSDRQLTELFAWTEEDPKHNLALSNPCFEYWLLLHFESGTNIRDTGDCRERLKKHLPNYDKTLNDATMSKLLDRIPDALKNAGQREQDLRGNSQEPMHANGLACECLGVTSVHHLVQSIWNKKIQAA